MHFIYWKPIFLLKQQKIHRVPQCFCSLHCQFTLYSVNVDIETNIIKGSAFTPAIEFVILYTCEEKIHKNNLCHHVFFCFFHFWHASASENITSCHVSPTTNTAVSISEIKNDVFKILTEIYGVLSGTLWGKKVLKSSILSLQTAGHYTGEHNGGL